MISIKTAYYINMTNEEILLEPLDSPSFKIFATPKEVSILERALQKNQEKDLETYIRAHIPSYVAYEPRDNPKNKEYDKTMRIIYAIIYALGDVEAKRHIESMGILSNKTFNDPTTAQEEVHNQI